MNSTGTTEAETLVRFTPSPMRVLIEQTDEIVEQQKSPIIIPDQAKDNDCARVGVIVAVGVIDFESYPWPLHVGDIVLFHVHDALKVKVDGTDYYLTALDGVLGRYKPKDAV